MSLILLGSFSLTADDFFIEVADREGVTLPNDPQTSQILIALDAEGTINAADFAGSEDLISFGFFANDFDTKTQGIDLVASNDFDFGDGVTTLSMALNWTETEVTRRGNLSDTRLRQLEDALPAFKGNINLRHATDRWRALGRVNYHSSYFEAHLEDGTLPIEASAEYTVDVELGYNITDQAEIIVGVANLLDEYPDENPHSGVAGARYPATAPFGFSGGQYYLRVLYSF